MFKKFTTHAPTTETRNKILVLFFAATIMVASFVGFFIGKYVQESKYTKFLKGFRNIRENSDKYVYINPLIGAVSPPATSVGIFSDIKGDVVAYLQSEMRAGDLYGYSFYFRDLGTSLWFGTNENADFFPASLFKLPVAIAVYKEAEDTPSFLQEMGMYTKEIADLNDQVQLNSKSSLIIGRSYSVEDLVSIMIKDSDNGAKNLLLTLLDKKYIDQLFEAIALIDPSKTKTYTISSRQYALFLRILYGSSYLNEAHSEYIMSLLAQTKFEDGIVAGVPKGVKVAHKFGAYEIDEPVGAITRHAQQLHECGIVYHEEKPYVLCLMTKGKDLTTLYRVISHVSQLMYNNQQSEELYND